MNEQKDAQTDVALLRPERAKSDTSMFLTEAALLPPTFVGSAALAEHTPFVAWVVETLRPRAVVDLAAPDPTLFFAACQAAKHIKSSTSCHLIVPEAPAASLAPVPWTKLLNQRYAAFADCTATDARSILKRFAPGTIDVLILHASSHETWAEWGKTLHTRLSARAVILLHGYREHASSLPKAFGRPGAVFEHAGGLAVIAADDAPALVAHLFELREERKHVHALFERLGQACARAADAAALLERDEELRHSSSALQETGEKAGLLAARLVARESEIRDLQSRLEWYRQSHAERESRCSALENSRVELRQRLRRLKEELAEATDSLKSKRRHAKRSAAKLLQSENALRDLKARLNSLESQVRKTEALYRQEQRAKRQARSQLDAILNSRSWRASAPFRALVTRIRR